MLHKDVIEQSKADNLIWMMEQYKKRINALREQFKKLNLSEEQKEKIIKILRDDNNI